MKPSTQIEFIEFNDSPADRIQEVEESANIRGPESLSDVDLLALIIGNKTKATRLLDAAGSMHRLRMWSHEQLQSVSGIGRSLALRIRSAFMVEARCSSAGDVAHLDRPLATYNLLRPEVATMDREAFWIMVLNRKNKLIHKERMFLGGRTSCTVDVPLLLKKVILHGGTGFSVAHAHPSGDPAPSRADIQITRQIREAAKTMNIDFLDHVTLRHCKGWLQFPASLLRHQPENKADPWRR